MIPELFAQGPTSVLVAIGFGGVAVLIAWLISKASGD